MLCNKTNRIEKFLKLSIYDLNVQYVIVGCLQHCNSTPRTCACKLQADLCNQNYYSFSLKIL